MNKYNILCCVVYFLIFSSCKKENQETITSPDPSFTVKDTVIANENFSFTVNNPDENTSYFWSILQSGNQYNEYTSSKTSSSCSLSDANTYRIQLIAVNSSGYKQLTKSIVCINEPFNLKGSLTKSGGGKITRCIFYLSEYSSYTSETSFKTILFSGLNSSENYSLKADILTQAKNIENYGTVYIHALITSGSYTYDDSQEFSTTNKNATYNFTF